MTNKNKNIFLLSSCFHQPQHTLVIFLTVTHHLCKCFCKLYTVVILEPPLMHLFESQALSLSTENGNSSKLDFLLLGYNLPRVTIRG